MTMLLAENTPAMVTQFEDDLKLEELRRRRGEKLQRQAVRTLVQSANVLAGVVLEGWTRVSEMLEKKGFEASELARNCQVLLDGLEGTLSGHERLLALVKDSGLTSEATGLGELEAKLPALRAARPKLTEALAIATRPARPINEKALAESRDALGQGEFVTIDDEYLARLRAGADF